MRRARLVASIASVIAIGAAAFTAFAQRIDARRPLTLMVGQPTGPAPTIRSDAHRDGLVHSAFPRAPLHVDWRFPIGGGQIEQPPVVTSEAIIVVTTHGDVVWVPHNTHDGNGELGRQGLGVAALATSAPTVLSDGTVVVVGGTNEAIAVGVDKNSVRFRTPLGGALTSTSNPLDAVTPLALDDGGVAVATTSELAILDSSGNIRVRAHLPEPIVGPLLATGGASPGSRRILAVSRTGVVYAWSAGSSAGSASSRDVTRVGSFQGAVEGGAVLASDDLLVAIVGDDHARMMTLDLKQGLAIPLSTFINGGFLGPVAMRHGVAYAMAGVAGHTFAIAIDSGGQEVLRVPIATSNALAPDGGPAPFSAPLHVPVAIDDTGTIAFAAPEGPIGIVDPAGVVTSLDGVCTRPMRGGRGTTSLVSGGPGAFIVTCNTGTVVRIIHGSADP